MKILKVLFVVIGILIGGVGSTLMILGFLLDYATFVGYGMVGFVVALMIILKGTE